LRACCAAAGEYDSGSGFGFAQRIYMPKLSVTGHCVNSNCRRFQGLSKEEKSCKISDSMIPGAKGHAFQACMHMRIMVYENAGREVLKG